AYAQWVIIII
nr:RecName: Full=Aegerolysin [Cyclocybe aegerita]